MVAAVDGCNSSAPLSPLSLFTRRVAEKVAAADLGAGQILQQVRPSQRRMEFDVKVKPSVSLSPVQATPRHDVKEQCPAIINTVTLRLYELNTQACLVH